MTVYNGNSSINSFLISTQSQLQPGDVFNGYDGDGSISIEYSGVASADFSQIALNGISTISSDADPNGHYVLTTLTAAELDSLSNAIVEIKLTDGGVLSVAGKTLGPVIRLANADTTLDLSTTMSIISSPRVNQYSFTVGVGQATTPSRRRIRYQHG